MPAGPGCEAQRSAGQAGTPRMVRSHAGPAQQPRLFGQFHPQPVECRDQTCASQSASHRPAQGIGSIPVGARPVAVWCGLGIGLGLVLGPATDGSRFAIGRLANAQPAHARLASGRPAGDGRDRLVNRGMAACIRAGCICAESGRMSIKTSRCRPRGRCRSSQHGLAQVGWAGEGRELGAPPATRSRPPSTLLDALLRRGVAGKPPCRGAFTRSLQAQASGWSDVPTHPKSGGSRGPRVLRCGSSGASKHTLGRQPRNGHTRRRMASHSSIHASSGARVFSQS